MKAEANAERLTYAALAESKILRDYERAFHDATGLSLTLVPPDAPTERCVNDDNPLCALLLHHPRGCAACLKIQAAAQRRLASQTSPVQLRCFAGLTEVAVPVIIGGRRVATLLGGQVFQRPPTREDFARVRRQLIEWESPVDLHRIEQAYFHTRVIGKKEFRAMVQLLALFAQHLAEFANHSVLLPHEEEPAKVARAKEFIQGHASEPIRMRETAQHVQVSAFYFCKMFKKATGITFTEYLTRVRVERVKHLLLNPAVRVSEAAFGAGFQSIPHFNRVFHQYTGLSPSAYRARCATFSMGEGV